jgi:hypothetical protein
MSFTSRVPLPVEIPPTEHEKPWNASGKYEDKVVAGKMPLKSTFP